MGTTEEQRGKRLKRLRKRNGWTLKRMAEELLAYDVNPAYNTISQWESGIAQPSADMIVVLASLFGVTTDYLLCAPGADSAQWVTAEGERSEQPPEVQDAVRVLMALRDNVRISTVRALPRLAESIEERIAQVKKEKLAALATLDKEGLEKWELDNQVKLSLSNRQALAGLRVPPAEDRPE